MYISMTSLQELFNKLQGQRREVEKTQQLIKKNLMNPMTMSYRI